MKRFLALALSFLMLLGMLLMAGCDNTDEDTTTKPQSSSSSTPKTEESTSSSSDNGGEDNTTSSSDNGGEENTTSSSDSDVVDPPFNPDNPTKMPGYLDIDFGGRTFVIVGNHGDDDGHDAATEIYMDEEDADDQDNPISLAVDQRNQLIETLYNCTIKGAKADSPAGDASKNVLVDGTDQIDLFNAKYSSTALATSGNNYNLLTLGSKEIDFTQPWFDQEYVKTYTNKDSSGADKLYSILGDFALTSFDCAHALIYNKTVYQNTEEIRDIDIYQLVRDHKWTLDRFMEMVNYAAVDNAVPGTYKVGDGDIVGWLRTEHATHGLHVASGLKILSNENGTFAFEVLKNLASWTPVLERAAAAWADVKTETISYSQIPTAVAAGQTLFASEILRSALHGIDALEGAEDVSIDLLPYPVFNEGDNYYHYVDNHFSSYAVPLHVEDVEEVGDFLAIFAYYSKHIVRPAYVNYYTLQVLGDEESAEMFEIVLDTRTYDAGYTGASLEGEISGFIKNNKPQTISNYANAKAKQAETWITNFVTTISSNQS